MPDAEVTASFAPEDPLAAEDVTLVFNYGDGEYLGQLTFAVAPGTDVDALAIQLNRELNDAGIDALSAALDEVLGQVLASAPAS